MARQAQLDADRAILERVDGVALIGDAAGGDEGDLLTDEFMTGDGQEARVAIPACRGSERLFITLLG